MEETRQFDPEKSKATRELVGSLVSGTVTQQPLSEISETNRSALVKRLRRKDKPILATEQAHGPG